MKTVILFFITAVISTGALLSSLSMKSYPFIGPAIAFGVVLLFISHLTGKSERQARQREKERLFYQHFTDLQNKRSKF
uniref:hypothetical protein n=1 Tax=Pedobacter schmidteae TaxID=2201271 RepID=UPI000EAEB177|nr:hypothetical protein [Pedobacter schmidteae]